MDKQRKTRNSCAALHFAQVCEESLKSQSINIMKTNKELQHLKGRIHAHFQYHKLDKSSLLIHVYSVKCFANSHDVSYQLGHTIFLSDKHEKCQPLRWTLYKSKRVDSSELRSEKKAFMMLSKWLVLLGRPKIFQKY